MLNFKLHINYKMISKLICEKFGRNLKEGQEKYIIIIVLKEKLAKDLCELGWKILSITIKNKTRISNFSQILK